MWIKTHLCCSVLCAGLRPSSHVCSLGAHANSFSPARLARCSFTTISSSTGDCHTYLSTWMTTHSHLRMNNTAMPSPYDAANISRLVHTIVGSQCPFGSIINNRSPIDWSCIMAARDYHPHGVFGSNLLIKQFACPQSAQYHASFAFACLDRLCAPGHGGSELDLSATQQSLRGRTHRRQGVRSQPRWLSRSALFGGT